MVYYICHCMSLHVCLGESFILDSRLAIFFFFFWKKLSFWLSVCSVVPLLLTASFFPFAVLERKVLGNSTDS